MNRKDQLKDKIRFLQHAVKYGDKKTKVWYSTSELIGFPKGTITLYAKEYNEKLPADLKPENGSDFMTDYFEKDRARITPDSKYYKDVMKVLNKLGKGVF